jgi:hypothetical protein
MGVVEENINKNIEALLEAARYNDMDDVASLTSNGFPIYNMFNL